MLDDYELEQNYLAFLDLMEKRTPAEAAKTLRLLRIDEEIIQTILEHHEQQVLRVRMLDEPRSVVLDNRFTWYTGPRPDDQNWPAVHAMLVRRGWSAHNLEKLDAASTKIVACLDHPQTESFKTYGLVVGYVQSGKTTNFTAVMAKAADRGYKLFIVLSGIHNALRRQTQLRLIDDLISHNPALWHQVTTPDYDFKPAGGPAAMLAAQGQHVLLVVKKNAAVLRRLRRWLQGARDVLDAAPTIIIDDEADQSTVATKKINPLIADIMNAFPKVGYVGYTATPFANLLIDPASTNDFYPRHFVVNLPKTDGYYGTEVLFGRDVLDDEDPADAEGGYDMIRQVPDDEVEALRPRSMGAVGEFDPAITESLADAVTYFFLATAARRVRGTGVEHSTMLIHTSVQTQVHAKFRRLAEEFRATLARRWSAGDSALRLRLEEMWNDETSRVAAEDFAETAVPFADLAAVLGGVLEETSVIVDNSRSADRLDYTSGPVTAIVIGGNTLSRGLTLEGLVVSFFVRAVSAYDTLLQMGRWFGYRAGYADLPRIWMTDELNEWFRHLATVEAEMRRDIDRYMVEDVTPETFAVRLRAHPKLAITAKAKMRDAVKAFASYGGQLAETRYFRVDRGATKWLSDNEAAAKALVARLERERVPFRTSAADRGFFEGASFEAILEFVASYQFHERSVDCDSKKLTAYIEKRVSNGSLLTWDVGIVGNRRKSAEPYEFSPSVRVGRVTRARLQTSPDHAADIKTLTSGRDEAIDLDVPQGAAISRPVFRDLRAEQRPDTGLLLLYPIDPVSETLHLKGREPLNAPHEVVMGVAFVFPKPIGADSRVEYEYDYYSADLSGLYIEEEDLDALEADDEEVA